MKKSDKVTIVLLNWNGKKDLKKCIDSLLKQKYKNFEVLLVDNGSTDDSVNFVQKNYPQVKIKLNKVNYGFAKGNNLGVNYSFSNYVILLSTDTIAYDDWIENLMKVMKKDKTIAIANSNVIGHPEGSHPPIAGTTLNILGNITHYVFEDEQTAFSATGCSFMINKKLIKQPFDDDYFIYHEDVYAGWTAQLKGYKVVNVPDSKILHLGMQSSSKIPDLLKYYMERNRMLNILTLYKAKTLLKLFPLLVTYNLILTIASFFNGHYKPRLKAYAWLLLNIRKVYKKRRQIQKIREVSDTTILNKMSCKFETHPPLKTWKSISYFLYFYCKLFNIPVYEVTHKKICFPS